ncbi:MAG: hypothetical protein PHO45_03235 [Victivallaceae bacterium]|jgi:phosphatidylglycerophosphate synthase|nr:hypothetical protein [Victivallaceae bacterium]
MSKRRHLGTIYESYPAKDFESLVGVIFFKLVVMIFVCVIWTGIFFVGLSIINFLRVNMLEKENSPLMALFESKGGQWSFWTGVVLIIIYILLSRIGSRKKSERSKSTRVKSIYEINQN